MKNKLVWDKRIEFDGVENEEYSTRNNYHEKINGRDLLQFAYLIRNGKTGTLGRRGMAYVFSYRF